MFENCRLTRSKIGDYFFVQYQSNIADVTVGSYCGEGRLCLILVRVDILPISSVCTQCFMRGRLIDGELG